MHVLLSNNISDSAHFQREWWHLLNVESVSVYWRRNKPHVTWTAGP